MCSEDNFESKGEGGEREKGGQKEKRKNKSSKVSRYLKTWLSRDSVCTQSRFQ